MSTQSINHSNQTNQINSCIFQVEIIGIPRCIMQATRLVRRRVTHGGSFGGCPSHSDVTHPSYLTSS
ncbi:Uncharacterized protein HZ326_28892 [Fusarium oxysporum f. sp. albedinis]|nr:Uncharacterized protein HZ326_28892 [Fusarium oxysporum f. sp. albedinis]